MIGYDIRVFSVTCRGKMGNRKNDLWASKSTRPKEPVALPLSLVDISGTNLLPDIRTMRVYYNGNENA
jgi:hypothetical protein